MPLTIPPPRLQLSNDFDEDRKLINDSHFGEALMQWQSLGLPRKERRKLHRNLVNHLTVAEGGIQEAFVFMKTNFPPAVNNVILSDFDHREGIVGNARDAFDDVLKFAKKVCIWIFINSITCCGYTLRDLWSKVGVRLLLVISIYVELIKDSSLMAALVTIEKDNTGVELFTFTRVVTIVMGLSVLIPLAISATGTAWRRPFLILGYEPWRR